MVMIFAMVGSSMLRHWTYDHINYLLLASH